LPQRRISSANLVVVKRMVSRMWVTVRFQRIRMRRSTSPAEISWTLRAMLSFNQLILFRNPKFPALLKWLRITSPTFLTELGVRTVSLPGGRIRTILTHHHQINEPIR
jgi:hypothetical protein